MRGLQLHGRIDGAARQSARRGRQPTYRDVAIWVSAAVALAVALCGTASASSTSVSPTAASATVSGNSPVGMDFPLERAGDASYDTWLHYETRDGTAAAGADYKGTSGDLLIPAGTSEASIPVQALGASGYAPDKQFALDLGVVGVGPTPAFAAPQGFATGEGSNSISSADLNGDGRPDLLVANGGEDSVSVLMNTAAPGAATPSFSPEQTFAAGRGPGSATAADVNGDGRLDLIVTNSQFDEHAVSVLLNTTDPGSSTASFGVRQVVVTGDSPRQVRAADLNGDGRPDLAFSNTGQEYVSVLLNTTAPGATSLSFVPQQSFATGQNSNSLQATDVNGDGRRDLVVADGANQGAQAVSVLLNATVPGASTPSFAPHRDFPVQGAAPRSVATADINGDGKSDLIVSSQGIPWVSVLLNTTAPGASVPTFAPQYVVPNLPSGFKESVAAADLNGDGKPDLIVAAWGGASVSVLFNTTSPGAETPSFSAAQKLTSAEFASLWWVTTSDLNGDGRPDLVVANNTTDGKVSVLFNATPSPTATTPSFAARQPFATGDAPSAVGSTDVNGDGRPDLIVADQGADSTSVLLNTTAPGATTPSFAARQPFATGDAPSAVGSTDVNGDGRPDLIVADQGADSTSVLLNTTAPGATTPSFAARQPFATGDAPSAVGSTDVNGDGRPDLIVADQGADSTSVLLNTTAPGATTPSFAARQTFATGDAPSAVGSTDVNGDGRPDLIVADQGADSTSVLLNTTAPGATTPSFAARQPFATGDAPSAVGSTDVNGDGRPDLIVADQGADSTSVLLNTTAPGATTPSFAARQPFATGDAPSAVGSTDVNGDGRPDLIVADQGADSTSVLLNTTAPGATTPSFAARQPFATGDAPSAVGSTDVNGDGSPDVIVSTRNANEVAVLLDAQYMASATPASVTGTIHYAIPDVSLSPRPLAFGEQLVGTTASRTDVLSNTGGEALTLEGIEIGGPDRGQFSQTSSCPATLAVGSSCPITVSYAPSAAAPASAVLILASDAPTTPDTVALSGAGYETGGETTSPPPFETAPPLPPRLRVVMIQSRAVRAKEKILVGGTIAKQAHGTVSVGVRTRLSGRTVTAAKRAGIHDGRWHARLMLPGTDWSSSSPVSVTARFGGSLGVRGGYVKRLVNLEG